MLFLRSLLLTSIFGAGIAAVLWLVSLVPGNGAISMSALLVVVAAFAIAWFWVHHSLKDRDLHH